MTKLAKRLGAGAACFVAGTLAVFVAYDMSQFQPYRGRIKTIIESAEPGERNPPAHVANLLRISLKGNISGYATRLLMTEFGNMPSHNMAQPRGLLWLSLVRLHYTEGERITIILSRLYFGEGQQGAAASARSLFKRELSDLSLDEAATLLAISESPALRKNPAELIKRKERLLSKVSTQ